MELIFKLILVIAVGFFTYILGKNYEKKRNFKRISDSIYRANLARDAVSDWDFKHDKFNRDYKN